MRDLGISVDGVRLVGGAARNPLWRSVLSACLDAPVTVLEEPESGALGGALQARWTARRDAGEDVGIDDLAAPLVATEGDPVSPDRELVGVYRDLLVRFREDVERLF